MEDDVRQISLLAMQPVEWGDQRGEGGDEERKREWYGKVGVKAQLAG